MMLQILLFIIGGYLFIGFILGLNILRKNKTDNTQKAAILFGAMVAWGYFFMKGIKRGMK